VRVCVCTCVRVCVCVHVYACAFTPKCCYLMKARESAEKSLLRAERARKFCPFGWKSGENCYHDRSEGENVAAKDDAHRAKCVKVHTKNVTRVTLASGRKNVCHDFN